MARVLVTGASGFVGPWLERELTASGHEFVALDKSLDVRDSDALIEAVRAARPDAIAHLAAVAFAPDASADPDTAYAVAVVGTVNVVEAARLSPGKPAVFVTGSSEVYGPPRLADLPLREVSPLRPRGTYGTSKLAQESVAVAHAARYGVRAVVTRSFNHTGPGQRPDFVVPALASRVAAAVREGSDHIVVGNLDVRRDLSDVRDVVRAYRLLLERAIDGSIGNPPAVFNVCSGIATSIRSVAEEFVRLSGKDIRFLVDPELVRPDDPPEMRGDPGLLQIVTGWRAAIPQRDTLRDVWESVDR